MQEHRDAPFAGRVLVLGANGRLGRAATLAFAEAGWQVTAQLRRAPRAPLPAGVTPLLSDTLDAAPLRAAALGQDVIVHALNPDYTRWDRDLPPMTAAVIDLACAADARLMVPGNVYNFGRALPPRLDESTPFVGDHPKARQRIAFEQALADAVRTRGLRCTVLRAGDFLGDAGTWLDLVMGRPLARGRLVQPGPTDLPHAWAWLSDLARTFVRVAEVTRDAPPCVAPFEVLHVEGHTLTGAQLQQALADASGRPLRAQPMRWWPLRLAAPWVPMVRAVLEMRHLWTRPHALDGRRLQALIGPPPHTPLAEVAAACVRQLGLSPVAQPSRPSGA